MYHSGSQPHSWRPPSTACFPCLLNQTHLIQIISSLVENTRPEMGVSERGWELLMYHTLTYAFFQYSLIHTDSVNSPVTNSGCLML